MKTQIKDLPKSQKEITVEISLSEMDKYTDKAIQKLSQSYKFDGFRQGKAPKHIVEQQFGKHKIFDEASLIAVEDSYLKTVRENKLAPIGQPKANFIKAAPGNPLEYKIIVSVMPIVNLWDYSQLSEKLQVKEIGDDRIEQEIEILRKKRASYVVKEEAAQKGDKVEIDFESKINGVKIEGGESKNHPLVLGEGRFIPGFEDNLAGMKKGDKKEFSLIFPEDYYKKELSGKNVSFKVEMKSVQKVNLPQTDDDFAKSLGKFENLENLKKNIREGLVAEEEMFAKEKLRNKLIDKICEKTAIEIPDILIDAELENMFNEFKNNVTQTGINFDDYLGNLKTTAEKLKEEWRPMAEKRAKSGLIMREIAIKEGIRIESGEIEQRINQTLNIYPNEKEIKKKHRH